MIRIAGHVARAAIAAAIVLGPPTAATAWLLQSKPRPDIAELRLGVDPSPEAVLPLLAAAAATAIWLLVSFLIVRACLHRAQRLWRSMRNLPLPSPVQATASSLAGAALLAMPTLAVSSDTASPPPAAGSTNPGPTGPTRQEVNAGVALPDGSWLPAHAARDVATVIGLTWLRRRQTQDPGCPLPPPPVLPDAATIAAAHAPDEDDGPLPVEQLPTGAITFAGPGAADAARGVLVTAVLAAATRTAGAPQVVITPDDLQSLLGTENLHDLPGLRVTDHAVTIGDQLDHGLYDMAREIHIAVSPTATGRPAPATGPAVTSIMVDASGHHTSRWHIERGGTVVGDDGEKRGRLCVLSAQTATDLLRVASHGLAAPAPAATIPAEMASARPAGHRQADVPAHLHVLGECQLTIADQPVTIGRSAAWQILVYLAAHPSGATAQQLITAIWPGLPPATITGRLYTTLTHLRAQTRTSLNGRDMISHVDGRYRLDSAVIHTDLSPLNRAIAETTQALTTSEKLNAQHAIIDAYNGELAAGHSWQWIYPLREHLIHSVLNAYITLAAASTPQRAITLLRQAIIVDPYNDQIHQLATNALRNIGDTEAAHALTDAHDRRTAGGPRRHRDPDPS